MTTQTSIPALSSAKLYFIPGKREEVLAVYPWGSVKDKGSIELRVHALGKRLYLTEGAHLNDPDGLGFPKDRSMTLLSRDEKRDPIEAMFRELGLPITEEFKDGIPDQASLLNRLRDNPDDLEALRFLYCILRNGLKGDRQNYVRAKNYLECIFAIDPQDRDVLEELVGIYCKEETYSVRNLARARDLLDPVLENNPNDWLALDVLSRIYLRGGDGVKQDTAKAVALLERALEKDPTDSRVIDSLADVYINGAGYQALRDPSRLLPHLLRALAIDPVHKCALMWYYAICRDSKQILKLVDILESALKADPIHERSLETLANIYFFGKGDLKADPDKGIMILEASLKYKPTFRASLERLIEIYFDGSYRDFERDVPRAMQYLEKAVEKKPADRYVLPTAVWLYFAIGENDNALACLHHALAYDPENHFAKRLLKDVEKVGIQAFTKDLPTMIEYLELAGNRNGGLLYTLKHLQNLHK